MINDKYEKNGTIKGKKHRIILSDPSSQGTEGFNVLKKCTILKKYRKVCQKANPIHQIENSRITW